MTQRKPRFEIDTEGMRELQEGREPWQLAKELVSNAWDEAITRCDVIVKNTGPRSTKIICRDDGDGFKTIRDAWVLMGNTPKRSNPNVRGRFNIGEKEIISVAKEAKIKTSGKIIIFPSTGGRQVRTDPKQEQGTTVECLMTWGIRQAEDVIINLRKLLPPRGITYTVNGLTIPYTEPYKTLPTTLDTVLQDTVGQPIRHTRRQTNIEIYQSNGSKPVLYELGIPVQEIQCQYSVNVLQKIPLPPNRDTVRDNYLQDIYKTVLEATVDEIKDPSATWVRQAIEDPEISPIAVKKTVAKRYGDKVVLWSNDTYANEKAKEAGYEIVHGKTLSKSEQKAFEDIGLKHSGEVFKMNFGESQPYEPTPAMRNVAEYARMIHRELIGHDCTIEFFTMKNGAMSAQYGSGRLSFNVTNLGMKWFDSIRPDTTALILHEISHTEGDWHDNKWQKCFERLTGEAIHLALNKPSLFMRFTKETK